MRLADMKRAKMTQLYRSPNGDTWLLAHDPGTGRAFVRHEANVPSGGQVTDIEIGAFLSGPRNPEHEALLRLIGNSIANPHRADTRDDRLAESAAKEWTDAELIELGNMLLRGLSIEEIARLLGRDHGDVQDKVVEVGRACREGSSVARLSEPAEVFEDRQSPVASQFARTEPPSSPLVSGGGGLHDPGMEARIAKLEADVGHVQRDIGKIKLDVPDLRKALGTDFRMLFGALITATLALAAVMAKGFHWIG
jgi:hypothetical protein